MTAREQSGGAQPRHPPNDAGTTPLNPAGAARTAPLVAPSEPAPAPASPGHSDEADVVSSLPVPLSTLVGRDHEVETVIAQIREEKRRLVTLTGPGGVGKTRLALAVAAGIAADFAAGVCFVPLAPISDPALVPAVIARALGLLDTREPAPERLRRHLRNRHQLLVLDNFEHLLDGASHIANLVTGCPQLVVLTTSRERLRLDGEQELSVPPLAVPDRTQTSSTERLASIAAVRLFIDRGREVAPGFALTADNGSAVAEICRRLDGLPLAIELAAARIKVLPPEALLARLERRLPFLIGAKRDAPARQRTLRDTIAWSHDLLTPDEQAFFRRLGVFVGGFTLEAAEDVAWSIANPGPGDAPAAGAEGLQALDKRTVTLDLAVSLVDKSLLQRDQSAAGTTTEPRFAMLETVREFAVECLEASGELEAVRRAHAAHFVALAERAEPEVVGTDQGHWLRRLDYEIDNLRAALTWTFGDGEERLATALRLAGALWTFWYMSGRNREGRAWLERALAASSDAITADRARALYALGTMFGTLSDFARAEPLLEEAVSAWRALGDASGTGRALQLLSQTIQQQGDHARAGPMLEEVLLLYGPPGTGAPGDQPWLGLALDQLADALVAAGEVDRAVALTEQALVLQRALGSRPGIAFGLLYYAMAIAARGEDARALAIYQESIAQLWEQGDKWGILFGLTGLLGLALGHVPTERVVRLIGAVDALRDEIGHPLPPRHAAHHEQVVTTARATLGQAAFTAMLAAGRSLSLDQAMAEVKALTAASTHPARSVAAHPRSDLTAREVEVLRLIGAGYSNHQVADALFISPRTASTHAANILGKLGLTTRAEVIAFAHRHRLA